MQKRNKIIAVVLTVLLLFSLICSIDCVMEHTNHICTGKDCVVCLQLEAAAHIISCFRIAYMIAAYSVFLCVFTQICTMHFNSLYAKHTLVSLKVELLN